MQKPYLIPLFYEQYLLKNKKIVAIFICVGEELMKKGNLLHTGVSILSVPTRPSF